MCVRICLFVSLFVRMLIFTSLVNRFVDVSTGIDIFYKCLIIRHRPTGYDPNA
jgi:hypothetical protein